MTIPGITGEQNMDDGDVMFGVTSDSIASPSPALVGSAGSVGSPGSN